MSRILRWAAVLGILLFGWRCVAIPLLRSVPPGSRYVMDRGILYYASLDLPRFPLDEDASYTWEVRHFDFMTDWPFLDLELDSGDREIAYWKLPVHVRVVFRDRRGRAVWEHGGWLQDRYWAGFPSDPDDWWRMRDLGMRYYFPFPPKLRDSQYEATTWAEYSSPLLEHNPYGREGSLPDSFQVTLTVDVDEQGEVALLDGLSARLTMHSSWK